MFLVDGQFGPAAGLPDPVDLGAPLIGDGVTRCRSAVVVRVRDLGQHPELLVEDRRGLQLITA